MDAAGSVWASDGGQVFQLGPSGLEAVPFFRVGPTDEAPTTITALGPALPEDRAAVWVSAANGLFRLEEGFLLATDPSQPAADWITQTPVGPMNGVWWAAGPRLRRLATDRLDTLDLDAAGVGAARELALGPDLGLLRGDGGLFELRRVLGRYEVQALTAVASEPRSVALHSGSWWVATATDLWRGTLDSERWTWERWTGLEDLRHLVGGADGGLWAVTADGRPVRIDVDARTAERLSSPSPTVALTRSPTGAVVGLRADGIDVWVDAGSGVGFAADVLPWLGTHCLECHTIEPGNYADYDVFVTFASEALRRVRLGDMPRCGADLCPTEERLAPADYAVLEDWIEGGLAP
jgi:hypothetical protein